MNRVVLLLLSTVVFSAIVLAVAFPPRWSADLVAIMTLASLGLLSAGAYIVLSYRKRTSRAVSEDVPRPPSDDSVPEEVGSFIGRDGMAMLGEEQALVFVEALIHPTSIFTRISERVTSYHRSVASRASITLSIAASVDGTEKVDFVVPLLAPRKGQVQDGLRLLDGDGKRISTLPSTLQRVFCAAIVRYLVWESGDASYLRYIDEDSGLEKRVWGLLAGDNPAPSAVIDAVVADVLVLPSEENGEEPLKYAGEVIRTLAQYNPICVVIGTEELLKGKWPYQFRFTVERRSIPRIQDAPNSPAGSTWFDTLDSLRLALGVRLNRIYYPLTFAYRTRSYHLEVEGPEGTYLAAQELLPSKRGRDSELGLTGTLQPRRGQRRAHLYLTDVVGDNEAIFATSYYERAPGAFATVTLAAFSAAIVVFVLALRQSALGAGDPGPADSLLPALLAVPLGVSTLSGFTTSLKHQHPSLLSRTVSLVTVLICLTAFLLASIARFTPGIPQNLWVLLSGAMIATALLSFVSWLLRLAVERKLIHSGDTE